MKTKKLLSILMALMMMLSVVPFYASAEAVTLTKDNVVTWPTTSGEIWFGQKLSDGITLNSENALVTSDGTENGTVIPGTWSFADNDFVPTTSGSTARFTLVFTPEDQTAYTGFERVNGRECTCVVNKVTPVFVDEINDPVVATDVEQGAKLSTSTLSGGQMKNPYTNEIIDKAWKWSSGSTIVNSSGEYKANFTGGSGYNKVEAMITVKVIGTMQETEIIAVDPVTVEYYASLKNGDLPITGAKAVVKGTDTEVPGTFSIKNPDGSTFAVGEYTRTVIFTPDDTENYIASEGKMSVTVTKANYKFVNENGEEIVPELTLPYGTTFNQNDLLGNSLKAFIKDYDELSGVDIVGSLIFEAGDYKTVAPVGTNTYNVRVRPYNSDTSNYNVTDLQFILTIEPVIITTTASWSTDGVIKGKLSHEAKGTLDVFVDGKLVADDIKAGGANNEWSVDYPIPATGDYTIKVVYNPTENDPYSMVDFEKVVTAKIRRSITYADPSAVNHKINGDERTPIAKLGDTVELSTFGGVAFLGWKITDASGNEVDLGIADLTATEITFTMPDYDLFVEAMYQKDEPADDNGGLDIDNIFGNLGDLTEGDSDNPIENLINNIIALFKNIIEKITGFFRAIGDRT